MKHEPKGMDGLYWAVGNIYHEHYGMGAGVFVHIE